MYFYCFIYGTVCYPLAFSTQPTHNSVCNNICWRVPETCPALVLYGRLLFMLTQAQ